MYPKKTIEKNLSLQLKSLYGQKKHCLLASRKVINLYQKNKKKNQNRFHQQSHIVSSQQNKNRGL